MQFLVTMKRVKLSAIHKSLASSIYFTTFITLLLVCPEKCSMQQEFPPQVFASEPQSQNKVPEGSLKIVSCQTSCNPRAAYRWMKDGTYITEFNTNVYSYRIQSVTKANAGNYRCVAKNYLGAIRSEGTDIIVAYLDDFETHSNLSIDVRSGEGVVINLPSINAVPEPDVSWYVSGVPMSPQALKHQITLQNNLVLLSTSTQDNGKIYKAEVFNTYNGMSKSSNEFVLRVGDTGEGTTVFPTLLVSPRNTTVKRGEPKTKLECIYNARPLSKLQTKWYKIGSQRTEIVANTKYIFDSSYKRVLIIKNPDMNDVGQYECEAVFSNNGQSSTKTSVAYITVYEAPLISSQIQSLYVRDYGQSIQVDCVATGNPSPTITWYFNANPVSSIGNNRLSVTQAGSLVINNLDLSDSGMYQCFATNDAGETKQSTWIKVDKSPPAFINSPLNLTLVEGADARFPCEVSGAPKPVIIWQKKKGNVESEVITGGRYQIQPQTGELLIITTKPSDSALFSCNASNSQGSISAEAYLNVYQRTQITQPPLTPTEAVKGSVASLQCGVSHDVNVNITWKWYQDNVELTASDRITIEQDGTLKILGVFSEDNGLYKCEVISAGGNDSRTTTLKVIELPFQPVITSVSVPQTALKSANISFIPGSSGNTPIERFIFQKRMVTFYPEKGLIMGPEEGWETYPQDVLPAAHFFVMPNLRPARYFQFRVSSVNKLGEGPPSDAKPVVPLLMPEQPPEEAPRGFYGSPRSNSSIMLNWQAPPEDTWNGDLLGYRIKYRLKGYTSSFLERNTSAWPTTSFELTGLIVFTEYEIKIAAFNNKGVGVYSDSMFVRTREGVPGAPPTKVNITSVNSTAIKIIWLPPDASKIHGVNLGYRILAKGPGNIQEEKTIPPDPNDPYNYQNAYLYNLHKFTEYTITVTCYTSQGQGPASIPLHIKTEEDVPGEVASLSFNDIFDTSVKVMWQPPTEINGILTGYTLLWEKKSQTASRKDINLSNTTLTYTVRDLDPTTKYTIYIYGKTSKGPGKMSSADFESGVPPERPGTPYNLGISDIQARSTLLQFLLGFDGKTSITLWKIEGQIDNNSTWVPVYEISDPDARTILVPNLRPFTNYRLRITAVNIVGPSNYSAPSRKFQTAQAPPNVPPDNVTVRAINSTALRISWAPLSQLNWNGYPRGYKMLFKRKDETDFHEVILDTDSESYTLTKLEEWMQYEVKMNAFNDVGSSPYSPISMERTRDAKPSAGPVNVGAIAVSSTAINVTWGDVPLYQRNGIILGYRVVYESVTENIKAHLEDVPGNETYSVLLIDLRKYVRYQIKVLAYTRMGDGISSVPVIIVQTHEDVPGPPTKIWFPKVTNSTANVVWEPPTQPNGILTGYFVSYKEKTGNIQGNSSDLPEAQREYTVAALQREQYYIFKVMAKTRLGWGQPKEVLVYTIFNRNKPDKPIKPQITSEVQARNVTISWQPAYDGYGPIRNYTIQYKNEGTTWTDFVESIPPSSSSYTVTGLHPNTRYNFRVAATNDIGTSNYSDPSDEVRTRQDVPEGAPQNLQVKPLTTDSIHVTWEHPDPSTWNGAIRGYLVQYRKTDMTSYQEKSVPYSTHDYTLKDLVKYVNYEVKIIAFNSIGDGPASTITSVYVGEAAPSAAPVNIHTEAQNSTQIKVLWDPPPPETHNGDLSGYKVAYWLKSADPSTAQLVIVREKQALLNNLHTYTMYAITVQAYNLAGEGPISAAVYNRTKEGIPGIPGSIEFLNVTMTTVNVTWSRPHQPNGVIRAYELAFKQQQSGDGSRLTQLTIPGSREYVLIDKLEEGMSYVFSVKAVTSIGPGIETQKSITMGPQPGSPGKPGKPKAFIEGNNVVLRWTTGTEGDGPISTYYIQANNLAGRVKDWTTVYVQYSSVPSSKLSWPNMCKESGCQFSVVAFNYRGISPDSDPTEWIEKISQARPFHYEWWFQVIVALVGLVVILLVISCLCLISRKGRKDKMPSTAGMSNPLQTIEPDEGGFSTLDRNARQSQRNIASIRNGFPRTGTLPRSAPRPSPASVTYTESDYGATPHKSPLPDDDASSDTTQKPSDVDESTEPSDDESELDEKPLPPPPPPLPPESPPPPPFRNRNAYVNDYDDDYQGHSHHQHRNQNHYNAYNYTDSEASSSHYGLSLNSGQIVINNAAGSRAPLPGFSSFV